MRSQQDDIDTMRAYMATLMMANQQAGASKVITHNLNEEVIKEAFREDSLPSSEENSSLLHISRSERRSTNREMASPYGQVRTESRLSGLGLMSSSRLDGNSRKMKHLRASYDTMNSQNSEVDISKIKEDVIKFMDKHG